MSKMENGVMRSNLAQLKVLLELIQRAEEELCLEARDEDKARAYLISAQGLASSQIDILEDTLETLGLLGS